MLSKKLKKRKKAWWGWAVFVEPALLETGGDEQQRARRSPVGRRREPPLVWHGDNFTYNARGQPPGNTHGRDGFKTAGFNRYGVNRAGYDMDEHYLGRHCGRGVSVGHDGCHVPVPRAAAFGVNGCQPVVVSGGKCTRSGGNAAGTMRAEGPAVMAGEAKMS